ncbi:hypothetical protein GDO81_006154 [Engystomops pustulosus]|uniref:Uncharacterized protein n=1 Tax=Engystomops pustulosus TaxID=76066 RepID=A0AAV7CW57_ENGPU|nr:hypothetical protein GDO81_006154 [Engystomops pustulosus]
MFRRVTIYHPRTGTSYPIIHILHANHPPLSNAPTASINGGETVQHIRDHISKHKSEIQCKNCYYLYRTTYNNKTQDFPA